VHVLLDKYSSYRPTERLLGQLEQYDLDLPPGTVNDGLKRIEPMLRPIYEALWERNRLDGFHQADETRWLVFVLWDGKKGYGWSAIPARPKSSRKRGVLWGRFRKAGRWTNDL
jgi:hypothetical protein